MKLIYLKYLFVFIALFACNYSFGFAADVDSLNTSKELTKRIRKADRYFDAGPLYYEKALELYLTIYQDFEKSNVPSFKLGVYYTKTSGNHKIALNHLYEAKDKGYSSPEIYYYLGVAFQQSNLIDSALLCFNRYDGLVNENILPVDKKKKECLSAKELTSNPTRIIISKLDSNINSNNEDYAIFLTSDKEKLYYTSRRPSGKGGNLAEFDGLYYEDTYMSSKENYNWTPSTRLPSRINKKTNDAIIGLSMDGETMLVYRDINGGDVLISNLHKNEWGKPKAIKGINTQYHESSACFSSDQNSIYFISNRPGGYGGKDIYVSKKQDDGIWSEPKNLGDVVNSKYDETTVFVNPIKDEIYFSSKGHNSMGGYDVFNAKINDKGEPINLNNMGYPINSIGDDISYTTSLDNKKAYYASQGEEMNDKDIYEITFLGTKIIGFLSNNDDLLSIENSSILAKIKEPKISVPESDEFLISLKSDNKYDSTITSDNYMLYSENEAIEEDTLGEEVSGIEGDTGIEKSIGINVDTVDEEEPKISVPESDEFLISLKSDNKYDSTITSDNYMLYSENEAIEEDTLDEEVSGIEGETGIEEDIEIEKDNELTRLEVGNKVVLNNVFFDNDKSTLKKKSIIELEKIGDFLEKNKHLEVEISGHTDSNGSDQYNIGLSDRRAQAVVDYLLAYGISSKRMTYKGYGETAPIDTNVTPDGRAMNRRTEFKITGIEFKNNR